MGAELKRASRPSGDPPRGKPFPLTGVSELREQRDELANALRWIANNCKPYGPAQAHAHNSLRRCGLPLEFPSASSGKGRSDGEV